MINGKNLVKNKREMLNEKPDLKGSKESKKEIENKRKTEGKKKPNKEGNSCLFRIGQFARSVWHFSAYRLVTESVPRRE